MGVYIKGMRMPENCEKCMMRDGLYCMASDYKRISYGAMHRREEWCPLVDLGKHGRLIDADELWNKMSNYTDNEGAKFPFGDDDSIIHRDSACFMIECADTIIEAEDGT